MKGDLYGARTDQRAPEWQPLLDLLAGPFMWMGSYELEDGRLVHAYKHSWTRQYLHLSEDGDAFVYTDGGRYRPVDPHWLMELVLAER